jgi:transmembrane sensor
MIARRRPLSVLGLAPDEAAAYWFVRLDDGPLSAREQAEFDSWHAASAVNAAAFARARKAWDLFAEADGDSHLQALRESALEVGPESRRGVWFGVAAGIAACLLVAVVLNVGLLQSAPGRRVGAIAGAAPAAAAASTPTEHDFATGKGERRTIDLIDGTVLTLNTQSAVHVAYSPGRRFVRLVRGQVLFEVAKDRSRPFVVEAADRQVTALGTVFEVRLDRDRMHVTLVEGKVVVDAASDHPASAAIIKPMVLAPGQEFVATTGAAPQRLQVDVDQQLRWCKGFVEFNDVPLAEAAQEMNRYSDQRLVFHDDATANLRISGVFRTDNPERFGAIVGELLPVRTRLLPNGDIEFSMAGQHAG